MDVTQEINQTMLHRSHPNRLFLQTPQLPQWSWIHGFILAQFVLQILLLIPALGSARVVLRTAAFALSLGLLVGLRKTGLKHSAKPWAIAIFCILALQLFWHPYINSVPAGLAQCLMYVATLAPLFWVSRLPLTIESFRWLILIMWGFHALSSGVGVLQVYFPDLFQVALSTKIQEGAYGGEHLMITLANGQMMYRPMGLTDIPGGAATSGFYTLLLGTGIALQERNLILRLIALASIPSGLFCIYLSQVRSILILSLICLVALAFLLIKQAKFGKLTTLLAGAALIISPTLSWALSVGGEMTNKRLSSLVADRPETVVYQNRGFFLEYTWNELLPQYPLGAGLGRWGTMNDYFGNNTNPLTYPIWVEIQWTGWLLDGGVPLILAYSGAILMACYAAWQVMSHPGEESLRFWAAIVLAYNIGAIAITFNYPLFMSQAGMEFWLINTVLFVAAHQARMHRSILAPWMLR